MPKIELIYFGGCPNLEVARAAIRAAGVKEFLETNVDDLDSDHTYHGYSSPSIILNGQVLAGSKNNSAACSIADWEKVSSALRSLVGNTDSNFQV